VNVFRRDQFTPVEAYMGSAGTLGLGVSSDWNHDSSLAQSSIRIPLAKLSHPFSICPASGRFVHTIGRMLHGNIVIRDFL